ncbi:SpoIIE family protein phosphatase [Thalassospira sp. HF15]|uniref:SpoIIE family protein phosphatase n=1 Tax=Thalassospira sp. HF15 TaxID=2722755 RepID=UPI0014300AF0|nr:SpoIIE family protein phosphatase [Thalassospira sp. HF15]NIY76254.1 SpoIIE family protein phosphatase [Thalassospira sp. HF15]
MPAGGESRAKHLIAVAQSVAQEDVDRLVQSSNIWKTPDAFSVKYAFGQTPEDFSSQRHFSFCIMPPYVGRDWLGSLIRLNCETFVECFPELDLDDLAPLSGKKSRPKQDLMVCLSTRSAYHLPVARKFVTSLRHRGLIGDSIASSVEMAVQEAFANSLVHGNLELNTGGHLSMDRFKELGEETERRLASANHGARAIILTARRRKNGQVVISISDQGQGFTPPDEQATLDITRKDSTFGRGLPLIRSLCQSVSFLRDGRTIELTFDDDQSAKLSPEVAFLSDLEHRLATSTDTGLRNPQNATILIADDTMLSREIIASYLRADGFTNLVFAKDGEDTLAQVKAHNPDLIILDIIMPKLDGYAVCKALRADPAYATTPIIAQTALEENEGRTRIFDDGATDLILKPLNKAELIARTKIHLENRLLVQQLQAYQERTQSELELARDMQENLNPAPEHYRGVGMDYGMRISATFQMSSELGGDMWGLVPIDAHRLGVYIVDFAGHGLGAALNTFRLHSLIWSEQFHDQTPDAYLQVLNRRLKGLLPVGQYATMLYGIIDKQKNVFSYASAACTSPVLGNTVTGDAHYLDGSGVPLGVIRDAKYETREVPFDKDSFLLLYSDALIETTLDHGQFLSEEGLLTMLQDTVTEGGADIDLAAQIADQFMDRAPAKLDDDFTIVSLQSAQIPSALSG